MTEAVAVATPPPPNPSASAATVNAPAKNQLEQVLQKTYSLLGFDKTTLLPMRNGCLVDSHRQRFSLQQTHQADNLWLLACYDIGVVCGQRSDGLACILFSDGAERLEFLDKNPLLRDTLLTSSSGCYRIWMRIDGWYPGNQENPNCTWVSDNLVMIANRDANSDYRFDNEAKPVTIKFKEIVWPKELAVYWAFELARAEFDVLVEDKRGNPVVNDDFVAATFMNLHADIFFNPANASFYRRLANGRGNAAFYVEEAKKSLHEILSYIRPVAATPAIKAAAKAPLFVDTGLKHLTDLVELLKILAVRPVEAVPQPAVAPTVVPDKNARVLEEFMLSQLEETLGEAVTVDEAYQAYAEFCVSEGHLLRYSQRQFNDRISGSVNRIFGIQKAHDIQRESRAKRGFRNLRLKGYAIEPKTETLRTDRTHRTEPFLSMVERCHSDLTAYLATTM
jgi:hypothetical protein